MTLHNPYLHVDEYNNPGNVRFQEFSQNDVGRNYCRFMGWGEEKEKKNNNQIRILAFICSQISII